ncbi:MAG: PIN domain-containing protein [Candidatus Thermoplasmatota archaeon]|jgi:predicted nucleic acid-binding protein|nr:PIN domain-containing protein [Candidatus Thermoplasmatota archaeon]MDA8143844.1 PIN domain-containing protein [Thermoplasmatales archaeon]
MEAVIDTNVLVYDTIENSPFHNQASRLIDKLSDPIISSITLVEMGFVLSRYGLETDKIRKKLNELLDEEWFSISWLSNKFVSDVAMFIVEKNLSFREFNDWIIAYEAGTRKIPLVTFDKDLIKRCDKIGIETLTKE